MISHCPHCGAELEVSAKLHGKKTQCPECEGVFRAVENVAARSARASGGGGSATGTAFGVTIGIIAAVLLAIGAVIAIPLVCCGGFFGMGLKKAADAATQKATAPIVVPKK